MPDGPSHSHSCSYKPLLPMKETPALGMASVSRA